MDIITSPQLTMKLYDISAKNIFLFLQPRIINWHQQSIQHQTFQGLIMDCDEICCYLIFFGPGVILFIVGMCLSSSRYLPALYWISLFGPFIVPIVWVAIILATSWIVDLISKLFSNRSVSVTGTEITPPSNQALGETQGPESTVINQQNSQHESGDAGSASPSIIAFFPSYIYLLEASKGNKHCSLCKELLRQGELATRLPICIHSFHKSCIDAWLKSNMICPDCGLKLHPLPGEVAIEMQ